MRHLNNTIKLNRTSSHRKAMFANMLKALIEHGRIETTVTKAKFLKRYADKMVTLAKTNTLASRRKAIAELQVRFNKLTPKEARKAKDGDKSAYNADRTVVEKLFNEIGPRFNSRQGGYTRVLRLARRQGDNAEMAIIEYLSA